MVPKICSCGEIYKTIPNDRKINEEGIWANCHKCNSTMFWPLNNPKESNEQKQNLFTMWSEIMKGQFKNTGKVLLEMRENLSLTQNELADKIGVHTQFVSNWERGICMPPKHTHDDLLRILKFSKYDKEQLKRAIYLDMEVITKKKFEGLI